MKFLGTQPKLVNCIIEGSENNVIYCEPGVSLVNCKLFLHGKNALIYLSTGTISMTLHTHNNSLFYIGKNNFISDDGNPPFINVGENNSIIIGSDCPISSDVYIEAHDAHFLYDLTNGRRTNFPGPIIIGDHVWIGRRATILKNSYLSTGCTVGSGAVVSGKKINTGEVWAGNPAKKIKDNVVYGHYTNWNQLGTAREWHLWNHIGDFKGVSPYKIEDLVKNRDLEFWKNLPTTNERFIWKF